MKLNKRQAFLAIAAIWLVLCLLYQSIWIFSRTATAEIVAMGTTTYKRSGINWIQASYQAGDKTYYDSYLKDGYDPRNGTFEIRYLLFDPAISRANTFASNWGPLIMFFIVLVLITAIVFIRKDIVADQAIFIIQTKSPFVSVANNQIEDLDKHTLESKDPTASGDNNKISYRCKGEVTDLVFILHRAADYWSLKNLLANWAGRGINILLQKVFEDDFMVQEMVYFQTPLSEIHERIGVAMDQGGMD